jgi:hypothetical protein
MRARVGGMATKTKSGYGWHGDFRRENVPVKCRSVLYDTNGSSMTRNKTMEEKKSRMKRMMHMVIVVAVSSLRCLLECLSNFKLLPRIEERGLVLR